MKINFFFQAEDGIRDGHVTGVQTCALPIFRSPGPTTWRRCCGPGSIDAPPTRPRTQIGRASCRERVKISLVVASEKKHTQIESLGELTHLEKNQYEESSKNLLGKVLDDAQK